MVFLQIDLFSKLTTVAVAYNIFTFLNIVAVLTLKKVNI